jgi:hypothetical protein
MKSAICWINRLRWNCRNKVGHCKPQPRSNRWIPLHSFNSFFFSSDPRHRGRVVRIPRLIEQQNASNFISLTKYRALNGPINSNFKCNQTKTPINHSFRKIGKILETIDSRSHVPLVFQPKPPT